MSDPSPEVPGWLREIEDACAASRNHLQKSATAMTISLGALARSKGRIAKSARTRAASSEMVARTSASTQRANAAATIRARLDSDVLPSERPVKIFAGYGHDKPCTGCGKSILPAQVEWTFENVQEVKHRFHVGCFGLWDAELCRRGVRRAS